MDSNLALGSIHAHLDLGSIHTPLWLRDLLKGHMLQSLQSIVIPSFNIEFLKSLIVSFS